jgi:uncharacterized OB-fold protein
MTIKNQNENTGVRNNESSNLYKTPCPKCGKEIFPEELPTHILCCVFKKTGDRLPLPCPAVLNTRTICDTINTGKIIKSVVVSSSIMAATNLIPGVAPVRLIAGLISRLF